MLPILLTGGAVLVFLIKALSNETKQDISQFSEEDIVIDYVKLFAPNEVTKAKRHTTKTINRLLKGVKSFKVGKTGAPKERNSAHTKFKTMYLLVESTDKEFINGLEAIYNEKYISNSKNENCKIGSAGEMTDKTGRYYLYFIAT